MDPIIESFQQIAPIVYALVAAALIDTASGIFGAWKSGSLDPEFFPTFIRSHILERIIPILIVLGAGVALGGSAGPALIVAGGAAATAYVAAVVASISNNLSSEKSIPTSEGGL